MGRKRFHGQLIAVRLVLESYIPQCVNTSQLNSGKIIGTVFISLEGTFCSQIRQTIKKTLDPPKDFCFLNSDGWPLDKTLEDKILVSDCLQFSVITIQRKNGSLSRVGIQLLHGACLGFIYLNFNYEISDIRIKINAEFADQFDHDETFEFLDCNLWPVKLSQENNLYAWDVVKENCIKIVKKKMKRPLDCADLKPDKRTKIKTPPLEIKNKDDELSSHSILISYVHHEASSYARDLKKELLTLGFKNIFLDVDDISAGQDWQDVISLAVNNCSIFIPLVTPRYGETRWTNREAKLADDREKIIIPISFLDKWPPDQLAIQFVTLQYIPWRKTDEINGGNFSGYSESKWHQKSIQRVAREIRKLCSEPEVSSPDSASMLRDKVNVPPFTMNLSEQQIRKFNGTNGKNLIVISAHSEQRKFVEKVSEMLESDGYKVWTSMNMCGCDENTFSPLEDSQPLNSPLIESIGMSNSTLPFMDEKGSFDHAFEHSSSNVKILKRDFKDKVKAAKLVVLIFSKEYLKSRICWQQLFYCEQRKKAIVIKFGDFQIDSMILNLYPEREMISNENVECLKFKVQEKLKSDTENSYRCTVMLSVSKLRDVVNTDLAVYIIGGTDKISTSAETFCMLLGTELAKVKNLNLVTEGFFGAGDLVGKNFCEEQEIKYKGQPPNVYHIIPTMDSSDYSNKARQRSDGSFEKIPYGNTLYYGSCVSERDDIVAAAFQLCILIEGGERSACLAEKFLWNDCMVIPVLFNNLAFENKLCLKESKTKVPNGVDEDDWLNLNLLNCVIEERVTSVRKIVCTLLNLNTEGPVR